MSWERPDPPRDEDRYYEDESMVPSSLLTLTETSVEAENTRDEGNAAQHWDRRRAST